MNSAKDLYHKYFQLVQQKASKEVKQFNVENHLKKHPTDYVSVIANELLKSDIHRIAYAMKELVRKMEVYE